MATKKVTTAKTTPIDDKEARKKALSTALAQLERDFGTGTVMKLGENTHMEVQAVHTGSLALDFALGIGGVPKGRIVEIFGPESSGKTTVALHVIAEVQKQGGEAALGIQRKSTRQRHQLNKSGQTHKMAPDAVTVAEPRIYRHGDDKIVDAGMTMICYIYRRIGRIKNNFLPGLDGNRFIVDGKIVIIGGIKAQTQIFRYGIGYAEGAAQSQKRFFVRIGGSVQIAGIFNLLPLALVQNFQLRAHGVGKIAGDLPL